MCRRSEARTCSFLSQSTVVLRRTIDTSSRAIAFKVSSLQSFAVVGECCGYDPAA